MLLKKYFPQERVLRGLSWRDASDGKEYENDVVVLIDRTALLFEAKSGKVSDAAKRGADRRLKREIEKLMVEPALQSKRLMDLLENDRRVHRFQTSTGEQTIDSGQIDRFVRTNITFNIIGALSSHWPELVEAEIIDADAVQIPTMSLSDLDVVCEVRKDQATMVHYLNRRKSFEANASYFADEYDLLAFYLRNGFNIGETEFDGIDAAAVEIFPGGLLPRELEGDIPRSGLVECVKGRCNLVGTGIPLKIQPPTADFKGTIKCLGRGNEADCTIESAVPAGRSATDKALDILERKRSQESVRDVIREELGTK